MSEQPLAPLACLIGPLAGPPLAAPGDQAGAEGSQSLNLKYQKNVEFPSLLSVWGGGCMAGGNKGQKGCNIPKVLQFVGTQDIGGSRPIQGPGISQGTTAGEHFRVVTHTCSLSTWEAEAGASP